MLLENNNMRSFAQNIKKLDDVREMTMKLLETN